jgi:hypothetical protein
LAVLVNITPKATMAIGKSAMNRMKKGKAEGPSIKGCAQTQ